MLEVCQDSVQSVRLSWFHHNNLTLTQTLHQLLVTALWSCHSGNWMIVCILPPMLIFVLWWVKVNALHKDETAHEHQMNAIQQGKKCGLIQTIKSTNVLMPRWC